MKHTSDSFAQLALKRQCHEISELRPFWISNLSAWPDFNAQKEFESFEKFTIFD